MIRIAAVGDLHVREDTRGRIRAEWQTLASDADLLLIAGDLTHVGNAAQANALADELRDLPVPAVAVLGNHDYHSNDSNSVRKAVEGVGVTVLDGEIVRFTIGGASVGIAGVKGFGGGFRPAHGHRFGEPEMKAFLQRTHEEADRLARALSTLDTDYRVALLHYAPVEQTLIGERSEIFPFLGSYLLADALDAAGADLAFHGHAHYGSPQGATPRGIPVFNVARPVIAKPYAVYTLSERHVH